MPMLAVLDRIGYGHITVHGFRATFATWARNARTSGRRSRGGSSSLLKNPLATEGT